MPFFGVPIRNGLPIGLGSVAGFGVQQFDPSQLFAGGTVAGAWYDPSDLTTLFTTSAGTTPVAMPGLGAAVPVGLMLDKSQGLVLGSEQSPNPGNPFTSTTNYVAVSSTLSIVSGRIKATIPAASSGASGVYWDTTVTANRPQKIVIDVEAEARTFEIRVYNGASFATQIASTTVAAGVRSNVTFTVTPTLSAVRIYVFEASGVDRAVYLASVSVRELPGNHAIAFNDTTARPELRARVNLLTYSEEFDNAAWTKFGLNAFGSGSVANTTATLDPLGGNTADYIQENTATASHLVLQGASVGANVQAVFSVYMKAAQRTWGVIYPETSGGAGAGVWFNLATGVVGTQGAGRVGSITSVGNGWYRCSVVATLSTDSQRFYFGPASADNTISYTGDGTSGIYIWGADLRPANIGANVPAYQRIADANTYDTSGFPLYLRFDGIDDSMYTPANLNLSGTDKVAVFAGVRYLGASSNNSLIAELSADLNANNGVFDAWARLAASSFSYAFVSKGTASVIAGAGLASYTPPISNVFTGVGNIAGDVAELRLNGVVVATGTADQGTGNYGTYPLFIGARNNSSLWLNGHLHSLIIAGSAVSAVNISATEQWVAGKTGITI